MPKIYQSAPLIIPDGENTLAMSMVLGLTSAVIGVLYLSVIALAASKAMKWLRKPKINTLVESINSGVLVVLGMGVVASGATS